MEKEKPNEEPNGKEKLKINFSSLNMGLSGGTRVILELAIRLQAMGHTVTINAIGRNGDTEWFGDIPNIKVNYKFPSKISRLLHQKILKESYLDVQAKLLSKMIAQSECDINVATYCLTALPTFESKKGKGFYLVQNYEPLFFKDPIHKAMAEKSYKLPLTKLCVSKWLQQKVGGNWIGNGVNTNTFHKRNSFEEKEPKSILYIYRDIPWKGDTLALETLKQLHDLCPETSIHIASRKKIEINQKFPFKLHTNLTDNELAELYSKVAVLLFTSDFEGYGLPPLEAFACGTNVVSTNFTGNDYLVDSENCFLASNARDLANAALKLFNGKELAKKQLERAQLTVDEHDFDLVAERMLALFKGGFE